MPATDPFDLRAVEQPIANTEFAGHLMHFATVASTNDLALQSARSGVRHGVWIADEQTAGRGRGNHAWHSAPGDGLYITALISPSIPMQSALGLAFTTAIAAQSAISSVTGFRRRDQIDIRWPNDLLLTGKAGIARKCGGILIDTASNHATSSAPATLRYAVIGIGINVNHAIFPPELDPIATSLRRELPDPLALRQESFTRSVENSTKCPRREPLAAAILLALDDEIRRLTSNIEPRTSDLTQFSSWISGKRVRVETRDNDPGGYTGITAGLNPSGFLLVHGDDGQLHTVLSGGLREP
jgi:BirA family biotin operon repressor/biotin-[acetyl-CoA-carboxylase] ligase